MNGKYLLGATVAFPLLPIMYWQGKRIRASVPTLPEATGPQGIAKHTSDTGLRMLAIGESTIAGVGAPTHAEGFTGTFATTLASQIDQTVEWRVYARSGYTVDRVISKILPKIEEQETDLIVVGMGGNDAFYLRTPGRWAQDIRRLIEALQQQFPGTPIVFNNMPPIKLFPAFTKLIKFVVGNLVEIFGEELAKVVQDYQQVYYHEEVINLSTWLDRYQMDGQPEDFFSDGVHPALITYQVWGREMAGFTVREGVLG